MRPPRVVTVPAEWGSAAADQVNAFVRDVVAALSGELTVADNLRQVLVDLSVNGSDTDVDVGTPWATPPVAAMCVYAAKESDGSAASTELPWKPVQGGLRIASFPGLTASTKYSIRLLVMGG